MTETTRRRFLLQVGRWTLLGCGTWPLLSVFAAGCKTMDVAAELGGQVGVASGLLTEGQATSLRKSARAVARTFEDITPEQEYYIGRTVGAVILTKYPAWRNEPANRYLNVLGQTLAQASDRPETFGGYHFLIQDSKEINALAAPGGLIFITRGMLRCCPHEDALAAVLAHEIGHVQHKHGLQAIRKSRITEALATLAVEGGKSLGGEELARLTRTFEDSVGDITRTLINNGYSRAFESQADRAAVDILRRVGYDPNGLVELLQVMGTRLVPGRPDFASTHPSPEHRRQEIARLTGSNRPVAKVRSRQVRFFRNLKGA